LQAPDSDNDNKPAAVENEYHEKGRHHVERHGVFDMVTIQSIAPETSTTATATLEANQFVYGKKLKVATKPSATKTKNKIAKKRATKIKVSKSSNKAARTVSDVAQRKNISKAATWSSIRCASRTYPDLSTENIVEHEQEQEPLKKKGFNAEIGRGKSTWCCFFSQKYNYQDPDVPDVRH